MTSLAEPKDDKNFWMVEGLNRVNPFGPASGDLQGEPAVVRHSKRWIMDFFPNVRDAGIRWAEDDAGSLAASVAYYLALSMFPMFLLLISGIGLVLGFTKFGIDVQHEILDAVENSTTSEARIQVEQVLKHLTHHSIVGGPTGLLAAIMAAIGVFAQIDRGFDRIFRISIQKESRWSRKVARLVRHRFFAFTMLVGLGGLLVMLFIATMALSQVRSVTSRTLPSIGHFFNFFDLLGAVSANTLLFSLIYRVLPKRPVHWLDALRGGLLAALVWEVGRDVLGAFFIGMRYTTAYGAIGSFIALLLWCYYGISILFFGAEYVQILESRRRERLSGEQAGGIQGAEALTYESTQACVIEAPTDQMREPLHIRVRPRRIA